MSRQLAFEKLDRDPLHERVYRQLRDAIISAQFEPGQKLTVRMISALFGTSTMPVRAALSRLVAERAVSAQANGTVMIPALTREQFAELVELRLLLEGAATLKAAVNISKKQLSALRKFGAELTSTAHNNDADRYIQATQDFKFTIFAAANSPALEDLIKRLWLQIGPFMRYYAKDVRGQIESDEHDAIIKALAKGDGLAAQAALEKDIRGGAAFLLAQANFAQPEDGSSAK
jgi:DNA-binding GntR family transcriptional regulator